MPSPCAFLSYVHVNAELVGRLVSALRDRGVAIWIDRDNLLPGAFWRDEIRKAVRNHEYFIACFSEEYAAKTRNYMNEELQLAIDEIRQRGHVPWFIPVLLSGDVPDLPVSAGTSLRDIHFIK